MAHIRTSDDKTPGVRTFHWRSDRSGDWYLIKRIRRPKSYHGAGMKHRWICTCGDFMNRRLLANTHCKHIKRLRAWAQYLGGIQRIPRGVEVDIPDAVPMQPTPRLRMPRR